MDKTGGDGMMAQTTVKIHPGALEAFNGLLDATLARVQREPMRAKEIIREADLVAACGLISVTEGK